MAIESKGLKERTIEALNSQEQATTTLLSCLLAVQDELGYLPEEAVEEVASFTHSTINDVWGVASFYTNFRFKPPGTHFIEVCWGASCHVKGAMGVAKATLDELSLEQEGDTPDGKATMRFNTCLGACAQAPVISVDHRLVGRLTPGKARELIVGLLGS